MTCPQINSGEAINRKEEMLLPCPFCDSEDVTLYSRGSMHWVACISCGLEAPSETGVTADQATKYWNTRAALRASAAPEEGDQIHFAARALALANPEDYEDKTHKGSLQPNQKAKDAAAMALSAAARHSSAALPSDSGKAAPVAWRSVPLIAPTKCSCCDGDLHLNGAHYSCDQQSSETFHMDDLATPEAAALAPATEGGGREALLALADSWSAEAKQSDRQKQYEAAAIFVECARQLRAALSPSPSVGTPEMTSARRNDGAE